MAPSMAPRCLQDPGRIVFPMAGAEKSRMDLFSASQADRTRSCRARCLEFEPRCTRRQRRKPAIGPAQANQGLVRAGAGNAPASTPMRLSGPRADDWRCARSCVAARTLQCLPPVRRVRGRCHVEQFQNPGAGVLLAPWVPPRTGNTSNVTRCGLFAVSRLFEQQGQFFKCKAGK